jgi:hypothetical protein
MNLVVITEKADSLLLIKSSEGKATESLRDLDVGWWDLSKGFSRVRLQTVPPTSEYWIERGPSLLSLKRTNRLNRTKPIQNVGYH